MSQEETTVLIPDKSSKNQRLFGAPEESHTVPVSTLDPLQREDLIQRNERDLVDIRNRLQNLINHNPVVRKVENSVTGEEEDLRMFEHHRVAQNEHLRNLSEVELARLQEEKINKDREDKIKQLRKPKMMRGDLSRFKNVHPSIPDNNVTRMNIERQVGIRSPEPEGPYQRREIAETESFDTSTTKPETFITTVNNGIRTNDQGQLEGEVIKLDVKERSTDIVRIDGNVYITEGNTYVQHINQDGYCHNQKDSTTHVVTNRGTVDLWDNSQVFIERAIPGSKIHLSQNNDSIYSFSSRIDRIKQTVTVPPGATTMRIDQKMFGLLIDKLPNPVLVFDGAVSAGFNLTQFRQNAEIINPTPQYPDQLIAVKATSIDGTQHDIAIFVRKREMIDGRIEDKFVFYKGGKETDRDRLVLDVRERLLAQRRVVPKVETQPEEVQPETPPDTNPELDTSGLIDPTVLIHSEHLQQLNAQNLPIEQDKRDTIESLTGQIDALRHDIVNPDMTLDALTQKWQYRFIDITEEDRNDAEEREKIIKDWLLQKVSYQLNADRSVEDLIWNIVKTHHPETFEAAKKYHDAVEPNHISIFNEIVRHLEESKRNAIIDQLTELITKTRGTLRTVTDDQDLKTQLISQAEQVSQLITAKLQPNEIGELSGIQVGDLRLMQAKISHELSSALVSKIVIDQVIQRITGEFINDILHRSTPTTESSEASDESDQELLQKARQDIASLIALRHHVGEEETQDSSAERADDEEALGTDIIDDKRIERGDVTKDEQIDNKTPRRRSFIDTAQAKITVKNTYVDIEHAIQSVVSAQKNATVYIHNVNGSHLYGTGHEWYGSANEASTLHIARAQDVIRLRLGRSSTAYIGEAESNIVFSKTASAKDSALLFTHENTPIITIDEEEVGRIYNLGIESLPVPSEVCTEETSARDNIVTFASDNEQFVLIKAKSRAGEQEAFAVFVRVQYEEKEGDEVKPKDKLVFVGGGQYRDSRYLIQRVKKKYPDHEFADFAEKIKLLQNLPMKIIDSSQKEEEREGVLTP